jgi:outer membrane biosynthesis protein TonB
MRGRRIVIMKKEEEVRDNKTEKDEEIKKGKTQKEVKEEVKEEKEKAIEEEKKQEEHFKEPDLPVLFVWFISMLSGKAWEYLGLIMNPETKEINKDLKKAKIAIDTVAFLYDQIKDDLSAEDFKRIENLMANLRMNYVEKLKES